MAIVYQPFSLTQSGHPSAAIDVLHHLFV